MSVEFTINITTTIPNNPDDEYPDTGPYMTLAAYFDGVACRAFGPDEDCRWVYIDALGNLQEQPITKPRASHAPAQTICVAYYAA